jgi:hypothetical protein
VGPIGTLRRQGSAQEDTDFGLADIDLVSQEVDVVSVPRKLRISSVLGSSFRQAAARPLSRSSGDLPVALRRGAGLAGALGCNPSSAPATRRVACWGSWPKPPILCTNDEVPLSPYTDHGDSEA